MKLLKITLALFVISLFTTTTNVYSCLPTIEKSTDAGSEVFYGFYDLRER